MLHQSSIETCTIFYYIVSAPVQKNIGMTCASCFPEHTNIRNNIAYEKRGHHQQLSNPPCGIIIRCAHINCSYDLLRIMFIVYLSINLIEFMLEKRKLHCLSIRTIINKRYESDSCLFLLMEILRNFFFFMDKR